MTKLIFLSMLGLLPQVVFSSGICEERLIAVFSMSNKNAHGIDIDSIQSKKIVRFEIRKSGPMLVTESVDGARSTMNTPVTLGVGCGLAGAKVGNFLVTGRGNSEKFVITTIDPIENEIFSAYMSERNIKVPKTSQDSAGALANVYERIHQAKCVAAQKLEICDRIAGNCSSGNADLRTKGSCISLYLRQASVSKSKAALKNYCKTVGSELSESCSSELERIHWPLK